MKFKVGDKVRIIGHEHIHQFRIGDIVEIICVYEDERYYKAAKKNEECCVGGEKYLYQFVYEDDIAAINMKSWELLKEIAEGNIKEGTKLKCKDIDGDEYILIYINGKILLENEEIYSNCLLECKFEIIGEKKDIKKIKEPYCNIEIFDESDAGIRDSAYWFNVFSKNDSNLLDYCSKLHEKQNEIIKELNKLKKEINE